MVIKYIVNTRNKTEHLTKISWPLYIEAVKAQYPETKTTIEIGHKDRITKKISNRTWILVNNGETRHSDRLDDPCGHLDKKVDKAYIKYEDSEENNSIKPAFYYNPLARKKNGADPDFIEYSKERLKTEGFLAKKEENTFFLKRVFSDLMTIYKKIIK